MGKGEYEGTLMSPMVANITSVYYQVNRFEEVFQAVICKPDLD